MERSLPHMKIGKHVDKLSVPARMIDYLLSTLLVVGTGAPSERPAST